MLRHVNVLEIRNTAYAFLKELNIKTLDKERPCGEDKPVMKALDLEVANNSEEGSLVLDLKNEKREVFFSIIIQNGRMSFVRIAKRPKNKPSEEQELCETEDLGIQWLSKSSQKKIRSNPVGIVVGEFRLKV